MGVIKRGILGGFSGKIGNIVGSSWKGIAVIKSLPLSVANPRTAAQVAQRSDFKTVAIFASTVLATIVKPLWDRFASQMSGYNNFIKTNIVNLSAVENEMYKDFKMSVGKMASTPIVGSSCTNVANNMNVSWADDSGEGLKLSTDKPFVVVIFGDGEGIYSMAGSGDRSDEILNLPLPETFASGTVITAFLSFLRADGTVVSTSSVNLSSVSAAG